MTDQTPTNTLTDEPAIDFIKRLINAWDCCGTCAGGVLAERDRRVLAAREAHTNTLREAANALNTEAIGFKPDGWGSNPADQQSIDLLRQAVQWLRARAADLDAAPAPTDGGPA